MDITELLTSALQFVDKILVPVIFAIAFVVFIWGVFTYFIAGDNDEKRKEGRTFVLYGIIGFAIMVSVWGLVNVVVKSLGFEGSSRPDLPTFGAPSNSSNTNSPFESSGTIQNDTTLAPTPATGGELQTVNPLVSPTINPSP